MPLEVACPEPAGGRPESSLRLPSWPERRSRQEKIQKSLGDGGLRPDFAGVDVNVHRIGRTATRNAALVERELLPTGLGDADVAATALSTMFATVSSDTVMLRPGTDRAM